MVEVLVQPTDNAISINEARAYLRIANDGDDVSLSLLIKAACERVENRIFKALTNRKLRQSFGSFEISTALEFANKVGAKPFLRPQLGGVTSLSAVRIMDIDGIWRMPHENFIILHDDAFQLNGNAEAIEIEYWAGADNPIQVAHTHKLLILEELSRIIQIRDNEGFKSDANLMIGVRL